MLLFHILCNLNLIHQIMSGIVILSSDSSKRTLVSSAKLNSTDFNRDIKRRYPGIKCQVDLGSGNTECCVQNCSTNFLSAINKSYVAFVTFPKDPSRFTEWTRAIGRQDLMSFIGKKEATNLLVCSKHFSEDMWVNSNTRLKRLHKSAVPEIRSEDEVSVLEINTVDKISTVAKKGGLKIKKVSSLLTESALNEISKWPLPNLPRSKPTASTDLEKNLLSENAQLTSELDKNMDYILNQKAHYEGILSKEKRKNEELESKVELLETAQRKLWQTYESQLQSQQTVVNAKEIGRKEMVTRMKHLETSNDSLEKRLSAAQNKVTSLQTVIKDLETKLAEMGKEHPLPLPPEPVFIGERLKSLIDKYLRRETRLKERIDKLTSELDRQETSDGEESILNLAAGRLNHVQLSWLAVALRGADASAEFQDHLKEFCLSLYEASDDAYAVFAKTFGLPPLERVRMWSEEPPEGLSTVNSSINALFEESESTPLSFSINHEKQRDWPRSRCTREKTPPLKRKRFNEDDDGEEGRASEDEEFVIFSDSEEDDGKSYRREGKADYSRQGAFEVRVPTTAGTSGEPQPDFDFILEEEEVTTQQDEDSNTTRVGSSMPLLVPDSPMTPLPNLDGVPQTHPGPSETKISNQKKVITSDSSLASGSKVVFRVIES